MASREGDTIIFTEVEAAELGTQLEMGIQEALDLAEGYIAQSSDLIEQARELNDSLERDAVNHANKLTYNAARIAVQAGHLFGLMFEEHAQRMIERELSK